MSIRAPYQTFYTPDFRPFSFEREVLYETVGALWALSAKNVSGQFAIQLQIDLSRLNLLYGVPAMQVPQNLMCKLLSVFQFRPKVGDADLLTLTNHQAVELMEGMNECDFLNFSAGFSDATKQLLEPHDAWCLDCREAFSALKYQSMSVMESRMTNSSVKRQYAELLVHYLQTTQHTFRLANSTFPFAQDQ